jgi:hypothetical protein
VLVLLVPFTLSLEGSEFNEGSLEVPNSNPDARPIFPYVHELALYLASKTPSVFRP